MKSINKSNGQIVILFAIYLIALIGMVGLAIDSGLAYGVKAKLSAAVDAAVIAAGRALGTGANDAERIANAKAAGQKYFDGNFPNNYLRATPTLKSIEAQHNPNGYWEVSATATAVMQTNFIPVLGWNQVNVAAIGETIRRDLDLVLVLDTTGSLGPPWSPPGTFDLVKSAAVNFISKFAEGPGGDRVGLVTFAMGAVVDVPIDKSATRGFNKTQVINAINALTNQGGTASAEGMRDGFNELNAVPATLRSSQRVIVFFSDGAPNGVPASFTRSGGTTLTGDIYAGPSGIDDGNVVYWSAKADAAYRWDQRNTFIGTADIPSLPQTSGDTLTLTGIGSIPLASYNNIRSLAGTPYTNTRCNANKAARNMLENIANTSRAQNIVVFAIGLGSMLNQLEVIGCSYDPPKIIYPLGICPAPSECLECGCNIMKRVANTMDANTYNAAQPAGKFVYAANASDLDSAFSAIASEILRLTK